MKKIFSISIVLLFITILACNTDNTGSENNEIVLDQSFYNNFYNNNIAPSLVSLKSAIEKEASYIEQFKTTPTEENFKLLQEQWLVCAKQFSTASIYNYSKIRQQFLEVKVYNFPTSALSVESYIAEKTTYNEEYLNSKSTTTKGLGAIEYLLFNEQNSDYALELLQNDSYRVNYLEGVTTQLLIDVNNWIDFWENEYKEEFVSSFGESCTTNARCLAINQIINVLDVTKVTKIGKPSGLEKSDILDLDGLEAYRSFNSLHLIKSVVESIEHTYNSGDINFSDFITSVDDTGEISLAITLQIADVYEKIEAIDTNLYTAITDEPAKVEALHSSLHSLTILFSVDIASLLSMTVLPTDNDGD